jgi:hypothetical protein
VAPLRSKYVPQAGEHIEHRQTRKHAHYTAVLKLQMSDGIFTFMSTANMFNWMKLWVEETSEF